VDPYWERSEAARRAVPQIRAALKDKDFSVQIAAAEVLRALGDAPASERQLATVTDGARSKRQTATNILLTLLVDTDADLRQAAAESLGRLGDGRVAEPVAGTLSDSNGSVRQAAARALDALHWQAQTPEQRARYLVVQEKWADVVGLGLAAIAPLAQALAGSDSQTRRAAVEALGQIGDPAPAEQIALLLRDKHRTVRRAAAETLRSLGVRPADATLAVLQFIELRDWQAVVNSGAVAMAPLLDVLERRDEAPDDLAAAEQALAFVADASMCDLLLERAYDGRVSGAVTAALGQMLATAASTIPDAALETIAVLPDVPRFMYEFDAAQATYTRSGVEELDCSSLRQQAQVELERRRGADSG
jgi:HEAT repeat protein